MYVCMHLHVRICFHFALCYVEIAKTLGWDILFKASFSVCCMIVLKISNKSHNMKAMIIL